MLTIPHFVAAARLLLAGGQNAPELSICAGPHLRNDQLVSLGCYARDNDLDIGSLAFGDDIAAGPIGVEVIFPRADIVHVRRNGALWAPKDGGLCAIVDRDGRRGFLAFDRDELAHNPGRVAKIARPGIARARARLIEQAGSPSIDAAARDIGIQLVVQP